MNIPFYEPENDSQEWYDSVYIDTSSYRLLLSLDYEYFIVYSS